MIIEYTVTETKSIEIDESKLLTYAREVRERFDMDKDTSVNMIDILIQAGLDGDIFFVYDDTVNIPDYPNDMTSDEIKELEND